MKELTSYNRVAGYLNKIFDLLNEEYFESLLPLVFEQYGKETDGISIEDLEAQFNRTKCAVENIGCSEDYFSPNFPADLTFCWDTMSITDLRENQRSN